VYSNPTGFPDWNCKDIPIRSLSAIDSIEGHPQLPQADPPQIRFTKLAQHTWPTVCVKDDADETRNVGFGFNIYTTEQHRLRAVEQQALQQLQW
jgi:hypothetical protein